VLAALLAQRGCFAGKPVCLVLTGGNVDIDAVPEMFARAAA
jgi:threonine dehydratase